MQYYKSLVNDDLIPLLWELEDVTARIYDLESLDFEELNMALCLQFTFRSLDRFIKYLKEKYGKDN